jgi:uncharacterized membrane protein YhaH (DUF805 family)
MDWRWRLFSFCGRINRATYCRMLFAYVVVVVLGLFGVAAGQGLGLSPGPLILMLGIGIVVFISALAVGAKRLHDRDKSAWWLLLFYVPGVLLGIGVAVEIANEIADDCFLNSWAAYSGRACPFSSTALALCFSGLVIGIWAFAELCCLRGTIGTNRYGPEPLSTQQPEDPGCGDGNGRLAPL